MNVLDLNLNQENMLLLKNFEGTKGITAEYQTKDGTKRTAKKDRQDFIV